MDYSKILIYAITMLIGIALFSILESYIITLDTSAWAFTGANFIISVLPILPILFLVGIIVVPVYFIVEEAQ